MLHLICPQGKRSVSAGSLISASSGHRISDDAISDDADISTPVVDRRGGVASNVSLFDGNANIFRICPQYFRQTLCTDNLSRAG